MNKTKYKLILFDIDGTLIRTGKAGTRAMDLVFENMFSIKNGFDGVEMAGYTDINILKRAFEKNNLDYSDEYLKII